ncbi:MAG: hypothetical protein KJ556_21780 [Gammaproteobacteria bacterium]|nr:hypothetical protein [Gammaproteobacteria bacterium]
MITTIKKAWNGVAYEDETYISDRHMMLLKAACDPQLLAKLKAVKSLNPITDGRSRVAFIWRQIFTAHRPMVFYRHMRLTSGLDVAVFIYRGSSYVLDAAKLELALFTTGFDELVGSGVDKAIVMKSPEGVSGLIMPMHPNVLAREKK